jgi:hypothetical protein
MGYEASGLDVMASEMIWCQALVAEVHICTGVHARTCVCVWEECLFHGITSGINVEY